LTFNDNGNATATLTGTPQTSDIGSHAVTLTVTDPGNASSTQSFTIEVVADNAPPTANSDTYMFDEDDFPQTLPVLSNDTIAPDTGETLTITGVSGVGLGHSVSITGSPGSQTLTYSAPANFFGTETFTYTITDGTAPDSTDTAGVTIVVAEVNDPPTANDDTFFGIAEDSVDNPLNVLANDSIAPDVNESLTITNLSTPDSGGTVSINDNDTPAISDDDFIDYSPAAGFRGTETFDYTIADGRGGTDTATVNIAVFNQPVFQVPSTGDVFAIGSDNSDRIIFSEANSFNGIIVRYNNVFYGPFILQPGSTLNADGRGGNDEIIVAGSLDRIAKFEGGVGSDYLAGNGGDDTLSGGAGNDVLLAAEGDNLLLGGEGNDHLEGRSGTDTLEGGEGNDELNGRSGSDTLRGGGGNDVLNGGLGDDLLFGDQGTDTLNGDYGNDVLVGGDDTDTLFGRSGNDVLIGGTGSDRLRGSAGDDLLLGGSSDYDNDEAALLAILAEWSSANPISTRIMNIRTGATTGGNPLSTTAGSTDDGQPDDLTGDTGDDWFLAFSDGIRDQRSGDVVER
jgi:Ca2+-binding RTX toxin-like protein